VLAFAGDGDRGVAVRGLLSPCRARRREAYRRAKRALDPHAGRAAFPATSQPPIAPPTTFSTCAAR
jgi:hypothetical protein